MKNLLLIIFTLIFSLSVFCQTDLPIIGKIADIQSKKKVYISAETIDSRNLIAKVLEKDKTLEIVSDAGKADFILEFKQVSKSAPVKYGGGQFEDVAEMSVYFYNSEKRKVIAWSQTKDYFKKGWGLPKSNETYLAKQFLKAIK